MAQNQSLRNILAHTSFNATEESYARARGTTISDLRNVALAKLQDAVVALNELAAVCDQATKDEILGYAKALS